MSKKDSPRRTGKQNKALHKYCDWVATTLSDHGVTAKMFVDGFADQIDLSEYMVKDIMREIGRVKYGVDSTADWTNEILQDVLREMNRALSVKFGQHIPFPSEENLHQNNFYENNPHLLR